MIAFDTNHLVRHIVQDDAEQCRIVAQLIEQEAAENRTVRILDLVLLETFWVLESIYDFDRAAWSQILCELLEDAAFSFDDPAKLKRCLNQFTSGKADFADYLILHSAESESLELKTFDNALLKAMRQSR